MPDNPINMYTGVPCSDEELNTITEVEFAIASDVRNWDGAIKVYMRGRNPYLEPNPESKRKFRAVGLRVEEEEYNRQVGYDATFSLSLESAQQLMDELWNNNIRPSEDKLPTSHTLEAVKFHLDDMREIAFDLLSEKRVQRIISKEDKSVQ